jgi:hypothetical protein
MAADGISQYEKRLTIPRIARYRLLSGTIDRALLRSAMPNTLCVQLDTYLQPYAA